VTPSAVRDALKAKLDITGLRSYDTIPEHIVPPAAVVGNLSIDWDLVMKRGADTANLDVTVITGRMSDRAAQDFLDSILTATGPRRSTLVDHDEQDRRRIREHIAQRCLAHLRPRIREL
jgi:hypothetical protein